MKTFREIAEMHYGTEPNNEADEQYRLNRINALEKLLTEQCNIADVRLSCFKEVFEKFREIEHESEFYGWLHAKAHEA